MNKKRIPEKTIQNRRARFDYAIAETYTAGLVLHGWEAKALRLGHGHLQGAFVNLKDGELWLTNATIMPTKGVGQGAAESDFTRNRKLLVKQRELSQLIMAKQQGLTIIPLEIMTKGRFIKVRIASAKGKKEYDKREVIKKRDSERDSRRLLR